MLQPLRFLLFLLISVLKHPSKSQVTHFGSCPSIHPLTSLDVEKFSGKWFEIMKFDSIFVKGKCVSFNVKVINDTQIDMSLNQFIDNRTSTDTRRATVVASGVWSLQFDTILSESCFVFSLQH